jgi:hypothetical protein
MVLRLEPRCVCSSAPCEAAPSLSFATMNYATPLKALADEPALTMHSATALTTSHY